MADGSRASLLLRAALLLWPSTVRAGARDGITELHNARVGEARSAHGGGYAMLLSALDIASIAIAGVRARGSRRMTRHNEPRYMRELPNMDRIRQDIRFALTGMLRRPATPLLALLTCALGIGAATAMYSVVDGVLLRPLPFEGADRLVSVYPTIEEWRTNSELSAFADRAAFSYPEYEDWRSRQQVFEKTAATGGGSATLIGAGAPALVKFSRGTIDLFPMLHVQAVLGRLFVAEDWQPTGGPIVLTYDTWITRFGKARDIVGHSIELNGIPRTVIGVLPPKFGELGISGDVWALQGGPAMEKERGNHNLRVIATLNRGVTIARSTAETSSILTGLSKAADHDITHRANIVPRLNDQTRDVRYPLMIMLGATALLLLAACVNVAGLLLGAGIDRNAELAVRSALGAGRGRLTRQLMTESLLLALFGGATGIAVAFGMKQLLLMLAPPDLPRVGAVGIDVRVLAFAVGCTCAVGILFGLVPALSLSKARLADRMGSARVTSSGRARLHAGLVTLQIALAMVLLGGAGLFVKTLIALNAVDPGFATERLLAVEVAPPFEKMRTLSPAQSAAYYESMRSAIARIPGVEAVAGTSLLPFADEQAANEVVPEGYTPSAGEMMTATRNYVSGNYFDLMKIRIIEGRALGPDDDRVGGPPVTVVSERMARRFWPGQKAVGRHLEHWEKRFTVVGVVADAKDLTLENEQALRFYMPITSEERTFGASLLVRTRGEPDLIANDVKRSIWSVDKDLPITRVQSMTTMISDTIAPQIFRARLITAFAALALLFSLLGVYGVVNRAVSSRMREMGLRLALGARPSSLVALVVGQGVRLSLAGVAAGMIVLAAVTRLLTAFLFGTKPLDPVALGTVAAALIALAMIAVLPPSLRAARAVALTALRSPD